jgi:hypothetical protein
MMTPDLTSKHTSRPLVILACLGASISICCAMPTTAAAQVPDPPRQNEPWTPPETSLPEFLVAASAALFEQGMADPRGCEYRDVELLAGRIRKARGFVLPEQAGQADRFFVGWDGVVYRAQSVGGRADWEKDVRAVAESVRRPREAAAPAASKKANAAGVPGGIFHLQTYRGIGFGGPYGIEGPAGTENWSPLKLCLLLRLGRADLAELLLAAGTTWTPKAGDRGLAGYRLNYLTLARDWAAEAFNELLGAHMRADDSLALFAARRLTAFAKAAEKKADAMGLENSRTRLGYDEPSYFPFLRQLPAILADQERRAAEPARGPIPRRGGDPTARIAALIRQIDQFDEQMIMWPGGVSVASSPVVRALIGEGEPAVEPLLKVLETDVRLTRSVSTARPGSIDRTVVPVYETALGAITAIMRTTEFRDSLAPLRRGGLGPRHELAQAIRAFWAKNRSLSVAERWYRTLEDDAAGLDRWLQAAREIVQPTYIPLRVAIVAATVPITSQPPTIQGEELRSRRDPSVSDLLSRRIAEIAETANPLQHPDIGLHRACELAVLFNRWDSSATLPTVRALTAQCRQDIAHLRERPNQPDEGLAGFLSQFTMIRARAGGRDALGEYALWIRKSSPQELSHQSITVFEPMWVYRDDRGLATTARWLFNDPDSPWLTILQEPSSHAWTSFYNGNLYTSPLLRVAGFRDSLIAALANTFEIGTVSRSAAGSFQYKMNNGGSGGAGTFKADLANIPLGVERPFRACDFLAWQIATVAGAPECELYWPEDRRDRAVEMCAKFLKQYGDRFSPESPDGETAPGRIMAHLRFPALAHPATLVDVREARAIFSLEGKDEVRIAKVPELPIAARWVTLKDLAYDRPRSYGPSQRDYDQDGWIWQAEEIKTGGRWERYYGFVGSHVIARVPAAEIELDNSRSSYLWSPLPGGLDVRIEPVDSSQAGTDPTRLQALAVWLRNRRGVEQTAPAAIVQPGADGRPTLGRGVDFQVINTALGISKTGRRLRGRPEELKPKRTDRSLPGDNTRVLPAFERFIAARIDLTDWFDLTRPGAYQVTLKFAADSGLGAGTSNEWRFMVGDPEDTIP